MQSHGADRLFWHAPKKSAGCKATGRTDFFRVHPGPEPTFLACAKKSLFLRQKSQKSPAGIGPNSGGTDCTRRGWGISLEGARRFPRFGTLARRKIPPGPFQESHDAPIFERHALCVVGRLACRCRRPVFFRPDGRAGRERRPHPGGDRGRQVGQGPASAGRSHAGRGSAETDAGRVESRRRVAGRRSGGDRGRFGPVRRFHARPARKKRLRGRAFSGCRGVSGPRFGGQTAGGFYRRK